MKQEKENINIMEITIMYYALRIMKLIIIEL